MCSSYNEALLCQDSYLIHGQHSVKSGFFSQWVFDNADHNVNIIDGKHTFHSMGGIQIVTPKECFSNESDVPRLEERATANQISSVEVIPYERFENVKESGFSNIIFQSLTVKDFDVNNINCAEFLWLYTKTQLPNTPGYNGFMSKIMENNYYQQSQIICLPFLNYAASDYNTIYSCPLYAKKRAEKLQLPICFVTFDQPLYEKSINIIESKKKMSCLWCTLG